MTDKTFNYYLIREWTINNLKFQNPAEMIAFNFILGLNENGKIFRGSAAYLAKRACVSVSTIRRAVKALSERRLISVAYGTCRAGKCWKIKTLVKESDFPKTSESELDSIEDELLNGEC